MSELIYIDTNVYLDHFENRVDKMRPLGEFAFNVIRRTLDCEFNVVVSSQVLDELKNAGAHQSINNIFLVLKQRHKYKFIKTIEEDKYRADQISSKHYYTHYEDTLHALLAKKAGAKYLVTRNIKDFECLAFLIESKLPEEL